MQNPGLPPSLWSKLHGGLWHATTVSGLSGILSDGAIKADFGSRYKNSFCRNLGCVCLFDFGLTAADVPTQFGNWHGWFGREQNARIAIWLEIDREKTSRQLIDAAAARNLANGQPHKFIAGVEACHKGAIPSAFVKSALVITRDHLELFEHYTDLSASIFGHISAFESKLPAEKIHPIIQALDTARRKRVDGRVKPGHDSEE